jgi:hypothetical protein
VLLICLTTIINHHFFMFLKPSFCFISLILACILNDCIELIRIDSQDLQKWDKDIKRGNLFQDATVTALPRPERLDSSDPNHPEISSPASSESGRICEHDSRYRDWLQHNMITFKQLNVITFKATFFFFSFFVSFLVI